MRRIVPNFECEFESEVLSAVLRADWPDAAAPHLRSHIAVCPICADLALIAPALDESRAPLAAAAVIPDSGRVWWLAQRRARFEAVEAAARPLAAARIIALVCVLGIFGAYFHAIGALFQTAFARVTAALVAFDLPTRFAAHGAIALALLAIVFLIPTALYLALSRD